VLEDATPQTISFFARGVELPLALGLVVDFSGSQEHFLKQHHRDLRTFLREDNSSAHNLLDAIEAAQAAAVLFYGLRYTDAKRDRFNARNKYGVGVFDRVAFATGGAHSDARHEQLRRHFQHIGEEMRSSYELAYHSTNPARDGTFRKILIRPKRGGLIVRAQTGYYVRRWAYPPKR
jgi:Ca-activated chloride channel family protein